MTSSVARVLFVGAGGLGCASGIVLARTASRLGRPLSITVIDDDVVSADNLHRQLFFWKPDLGAPKAPVFAERFVAEARAHGATEVAARAIEARIGPDDDARRLVAEHDLVIEGADNFATKFLVADACRLERRAVVHGGVVRWVGYALTSGPESHPCYRCLFEDVPRDQPDTCAISGVVGPLVALVGALQARFAIEALLGRPTGHARYVHVDALRGGPLRTRPLRARADCALCGEAPRILDLDANRYAPPACA